MIKQSINLYPEPKQHTITQYSYSTTPKTNEEKLKQIEETLKRIEYYKIKVGDTLTLATGSEIEVMEIVKSLDKVIWYNGQACCLACKQTAYQNTNIIKYSFSELQYPLKINNTTIIEEDDE